MYALVRSLVSVGICILGGVVPPILADQKPSAPHADHIVAIVNQTAITATTWQKAWEDMVQQGALPPESAQTNPDALKRQVLEHLIDRELEKAQLKAHPVTMPAGSLDTAIARIAQHNRMTVDQLKQALTAQGVDWAIWKKNLEEDVQLQQLEQQMILPQIRVSHAEITQALAHGQIPASPANPAIADPNITYHIAHLLIRVPESAPPAVWEQAQSWAQTATQAIQQDPERIHTYLLDHPPLPALSQLSGEDLGMRPVHAIPQLFASRLPQMQPGEIAGPFRSPAGWHILLLKNRSPNASTPAGGSAAPSNSDPSYAQAREYLLQQKYTRALAAWRQSLRDSAYIQIQSPGSTASARSATG